MEATHGNIIFTRELNIQECKSCLDEIIDILKTNQVFEVKMMFGFSWGNEYKNWTPYIVFTNEIATEIEKAEKSGTGRFYNDDTFFYLTDLNIEILFCHEYDIHLKYDETNKIVDDIINAWEIRGLIREMKKGKQKFGY